MNKNNTIIGIVLPTYNRKELLEKAIKSIQEQSYTHWVISIVDDASTDGTDKYAEQFKDDDKIHYIKLVKNSGSNVARNSALDYLLLERSCDYIAFLDDDDYFTPLAFETVVEQIDLHPDFKWFISNSVYPDGKKITQITKYEPMNYIDNLVGSGFTGDATGFHAAEIIEDIRFTTFNNIRAREWHFLIQQAPKTDMFLYDFDSKVCEYQADGQTFNQKKETPEEKRACRQYENKLLKSLGYSFEYLELLKAKHRLKNFSADTSLIKKVRANLRILKWKIRYTIGRIFS